MCICGRQAKTCRSITYCRYCIKLFIRRSTSCRHQQVPVPQLLSQVSAYFIVFNHSKEALNFTRNHIQCHCVTYIRAVQDVIYWLYTSTLRSSDQLLLVVYSSDGANVVQQKLSALALLLSGTHCHITVDVPSLSALLSVV